MIPAPTAARRRPRVLLTVAVSVLALLVGGSAGVALGSTLGSRQNGPTSTPTLTRDFPHADQSYLRGVTVGAITEDWLVKTRSWKCELSGTGVGLLNGALKRTACTPRDDTVQGLRVNVEYDDDRRVREVNLLCDRGPGTKICAELFTGLAGVLLARDDGLRRQALAWATANVDNDDATVIGNVRLVATLSPHYLRCTAAA
ncbi:hypothetical protein [Actinopolymorpha pittospori]|uniref:Uncharacterized protein n=1 Tax=Actinopolymorpha pittospori TaxID=648752 RepID=A0A927MQX5_9ACTN|nr:hypothetical protein [Actinopolymorpha pittospori]MBE1604706.1 hypothetical protein [Actinopolymorpha pittospori]